MTAAREPLATCTFVRPRRVEEARAALRRDRGLRPLGGGTWAVPAHAEAGDHARWLTTASIEGFDALGQDPQGDLLIGAGATLRQVETDPLVRGSWALLAQALAGVAGPAVRNAATIGGSLALGAESPDPALALDALGARVLVSSGRGRADVEMAEVEVAEVPVARTLERAVLIERVRLARGAIAGWAWERFTLRGEADRPFVTVAVVVAAASVRVRAAVGLARPLALAATERALAAGHESGPAIESDCASLAVDEGDRLGAYRRRVLGVLAGRAVASALRMAQRP